MDIRPIDKPIIPGSRSSAPQLRMLVIALISILMGVMLLVSWLAGGEKPLLASAILVSLLLCIVPFLFWRSDPTPLSPVYITVIYLLLAYHIKYFSSVLEIEHVQEFFQGVLSDERLVTQVFGMLALGMVTYLAGFYYAPPIIIRWVAGWKLPFSTGYDSQWTRRIFVIGLIGLASLALQFALGMWSSFAGLGENWDPRFNQVLAYLLNYFWLAVIGSVLWIFSRQRKGLFGLFSTLVLLGVALFLIFFVLGSKTWMISFVLWIIMAIYMNQRRIASPWIAISMIVVIVFAFIIVPDFRDRYWDQYGQNPGGINTYVDVGVETLSGLSIQGTNFSRSFGDLISRFAGVDNAAMVISRIPAHFDYRYFIDFAFIIFSLFPRFLVPFKPATSLGTWYSYVLVGGGAAAAPHPVAEGYLNFGWLGVAIFFWFWGVYQAVWYRGFYLPRKDSPTARLLYAFFLIEFVGFGGWITGSLLRLPSQIISLIPLLIILNIGGSVYLAAKPNKNNPAGSP